MNASTGRCQCFTSSVMAASSPRATRAISECCVARLHSAVKPPRSRFCLRQGLRWPGVVSRAGSAGSHLRAGLSSTEPLSSGQISAFGFGSSPGQHSGRRTRHVRCSIPHPPPEGESIAGRRRLPPVARRGGRRARAAGGGQLARGRSAVPLPLQGFESILTTLGCSNRQVMARTSSKSLIAERARVMSTAPA